ncbi:hypothetical protein ACU686_26500 [Yinghuangia aomiensis]
MGKTRRRTRRKRAKKRPAGRMRSKYGLRLVWLAVSVLIHRWLG